MSVVARPNSRTAPRSGNVAPVTRFTSTSAERLIEPDNRDLFAVTDAEIRDSERTQAVIVLRDVRQLENRIGHD